jgi:Ca2+-binding EF-hand superfamily protein
MIESSTASTTAGAREQKQAVDATEQASAPQIVHCAPSQEFETWRNRMFAKADADSDGTVDMTEFKRAVDSGMTTAFKAADGNRDGELTEAEAADALHGLAVAPPAKSAN